MTLNQRSHRICCLAMLLVMLLAILSPAYSYAQSAPEGTPQAGVPKTQDAQGNTVNCESLPDAKGVLLGKIVPCMIYSIEQSTIKFTEKMVDWLMPLFYTFLTLTIVLFGVRVVQNEPEIYKHAIVMLIKITIIGIILADLGNYQSYDASQSEGKLVPAVYSIMDSSQSIVANTMISSSYKCDVEKFQPGETPVIWALFDCVGSKIFGYTMGADGKGQMLMAASVVGLLTGVAFSGPWGIAIFMGMLGVVISIFTMIIRTVLAFTVSYLTICLLIILLPLFMPLILMRVTAQYFEPVIKNIISSFLTPIIFTAFSLFALTVYDKILFDDQSIVQRLLNYDTIKQALGSKQPFSFTVVSDPLRVRTTNPLGPPTNPADIVMNSMVDNKFMPSLTGGNTATARVPSVDFEAILAPGFQKGKATFDQLFTELAKLVVVAFVINSVMQQLPNIIARLSMGSAAYFALTGTYKDLDYSKRFTDGMERAVGSAGRLFNPKDDQTVARTKMTTEGTDAFYKEITKKDKK